MKIAFIFLASLALLSLGQPQESKALDPAITALSKFIGGKWHAQGEMPIVQEWTWNRDKRGLSVHTVIGVPGKEALSKAFFGWDPVAKKPYYLDLHDSELTYYGSVSEKDGVIELRFGQLGSGKENWVERGKFVGEDEWEANLYQIKDGKEALVIAFKMKRKR